MMTLADHLKTLETLKATRDMCEAYLREVEKEPSRADAANELRQSIASVTSQIAAWQSDVDALLDRRARIAAELAKPLEITVCQRCNGPATPRAIGNIEDVLVLMKDADESVIDVTAELRRLCGSCFGSRLRMLRSIAEALTVDGAE